MMCGSDPDFGFLSESVAIRMERLDLVFHFDFTINHSIFQIMQNKEIVCHKMWNNKNQNYMNLWLSLNGNHQLYRKMNGMQRVQGEYHRPRMGL